MSITLPTISLRLMTLADIPRIVEIERASFPTSWPPSAYRRELESNKLARYLVAMEGVPPPPAQPAAPAQSAPSRGLRGWLKWLTGDEPGTAPARAESGGRIVGFLGLWFMVDEAHIVTVAVDPAMRRHGIGELLVSEAIAIAVRREASTVTLECRVSNTGAQALYEKYGFARMGIRKRYYTDNGEDALIMSTPPLDDPEYRARLEDLRRAYVARHGEIVWSEG